MADISQHIFEVDIKINHLIITQKQVDMGSKAGSGTHTHEASASSLYQKMIKNKSV